MSSFRKDQIIIACFENFQRTWNYNIWEPYQQKLPLPWFTLLIFKWGMVYGANKIDGKKFGQSDFRQIYRMIYQLPTNSNLVKAKDPLRSWKIIRSYFSGQQPYQVNSRLYGLAVTEVILKDIGINYDVDRALHNIMGITLEDFINFQCLVSAIYVTKETYPKYSIDFFESFSNMHDLKKIDRFLTYFSMRFHEVETFMIEDHKAIDNPEFEYKLLSPLSKKPLYRFNDYYVAYNKTLINNFCEYGLYDLLKSHDAASFSGAFGHGFETYLTYPLNSVSTNYFREKDIRREFSVGNTVDFLLYNKSDTLLIEAKSAEMSEFTPHNPEIKHLEQTFQNSLIKGYKQIFLTSFDLKKQNPILFSKSNFWGLIVTYKDFLFGEPEKIWSEFMEFEMEKNLPVEIFSNLPMDPLKIFVVSVYQFDLLCQFTKTNDSDLFVSITIAYENNKQNETRKSSFDLHFYQEEAQNDDFKHTKNKIDEIFSRVTKYIL